MPPTDFDYEQAFYSIAGELVRLEAVPSMKDFEWHVPDDLDVFSFKPSRDPRYMTVMMFTQPFLWNFMTAYGHYSATQCEDCGGRLDEYLGMIYGSMLAYNQNHPEAMRKWMAEFPWTPDDDDGDEDAQALGYGQ